MNYEPYEPSEVCLERKLLVCKKTGTNALRHKLKCPGIDAEDHLLEELLKIVRKESSRLRTSLTDEEILHLHSIQTETPSSQD
ncbi:MAG: hypothetical protein U9N58_05160 [Thermodesulfobacteriota bacterium]|nr:hypothetical protein [Thermodesulfobacteriota bacterium]